MPQRKFEMALTAEVKSLMDLAASLVKPQPGLQLNLISLDDVRAKKEAYKTLLPLYSLKAAAGYFGGGEPVEPEGWIEADGIGRLDERMFVAKAIGRSMEPRIYDGDYLVFRSNPVGSREGKTVLVQYRGPADPETGGSYTVKKYHSEKTGADDGEWRHAKIVLSPINQQFRPIVLVPEDQEAVRVVAEHVATLGKTP